ncbi:MAG: N-acetyltransferase [Streptococcaceae bacterium]|jgi:predicted GNAT family acetyltransferase|nr:N-acetyltransferase [Streptococcaceae bacterium]
MEFSIKKEEKRFALYDADKEIGEMTFYHHDDKIIVIDHTFVSPDYRGQKLAEKLVETAVENARQEGLKIHPTCPFALKEFNRRPEYADVYQEELRYG